MCIFQVMESYVLKQETRGEEESKDSNDDDDDGDDDDGDEEEDDDEEMGDVDDDNLLIEFEDSKSSLLPSGAEDSEIDQLACPLTNSTKTPLSEPAVVQKIEHSEPSKNGFLAELDVKPKVELLTSASKSNPSMDTIEITTVTNRESVLSVRNPLRALKRKGPEMIVKLSPKKKAPIKPYDDDDVIVLSD